MFLLCWKCDSFYNLCCRPSIRPAGIMKESSSCAVTQMAAWPCGTSETLPSPSRSHSHMVRIKNCAIVLFFIYRWTTAAFHPWKKQKKQWPFILLTLYNVWYFIQCSVSPTWTEPRHIFKIRKITQHRNDTNADKMRIPGHLICNWFLLSPKIYYLL